MVRLFRFGELGHERPGLVGADGVHRDVGAFGEDYGEEFFGSDGLSRLLSWLEETRSELAPAIEPAQVRWAPVVRRPSKIVCVGLNYRAHAEETGARLPREPKIFMKATTALAGVNDPLELPRDSSSTDYEVELALVIGTQLRYADAASARAAIFGYTVMNDYSEREFQKEREGQWVKGKSADGFAPLGPYLVPAAQLDPGNLRLWLSVDGEVRQDSSTSDLVFDVVEVVRSISQYMTLLPGDVISTGTPSGVGAGFSPPRYLRPGDIVRYGIDGIGEAVQAVVAPGADTSDPTWLASLRASRKMPA
ncbi:MAG TPA: fumarylacetoacetate hydrolase family protein [Polyangiaceae bacterium]|nr:fumarylacetoacetate hydrolase family protein [Polyangiaceae bacterium]